MSNMHVGIGAKVEGAKNNEGQREDHAFLKDQKEMRSPMFLFLFQKKKRMKMMVMMMMRMKEKEQPSLQD